MRKENVKRKSPTDQKSTLPTQPRRWTLDTTYAGNITLDESPNGEVVLAEDADLYAMQQYTRGQLDQCEGLLHLCPSLDRETRELLLSQACSLTRTLRSLDAAFDKPVIGQERFYQRAHTMSRSA